MLLKHTLIKDGAVVNQDKCRVYHGKRSVLNRYTESSGVEDFNDVRLCSN